MFEPVVVMPVYNHGSGALRIHERVRAFGLPCIVVDDGSDAECARRLDVLKAHAATTLVRLPNNGGKGAAVMAGLREALRLGFSHALQIDADGQHDPAEIPAFLAIARERPEAVVCGTPLYDRSVPLGRRIGRYATHLLVWINTLSFAIRDSMCGFRVYPLAATVAMLDEDAPGKRMEFDIEVLVRLYWRGVPIANRPTPVTYPDDGVSHFRLWRDNLLISGMHARLFLGMLVRAPVLLARRLRPT